MLLGIIGGQEIAIIAIILILLFGLNRIPDIMKNLGESVKEINDAKKEIGEMINIFNIKNLLL